MRSDFEESLSPEVKVKMKKNLVYVGIFSVIMLFAGFTSAYIVSMGDSFWIKYPLPNGFWISTILIILSSIFYEFGIRSIQKDNSKRLKIFMFLTLLFGVGFAIYQWKGYGQLVEKGAYLRSSIIVTEGRYGDYFEIKYKGQFIDVNANTYLLNGKSLDEKQSKELKEFVKIFESTADPKGYSISSNLSSDFVLYYRNEPISVQNNKLMKPDGSYLQYVDMLRLKHLAWNIRDDRGDFFLKGELGKDFQLYYKGKELSYKDRNLMLDGKKIVSATSNQGKSI
jgi:cytochrome c oxidase subunit III